MNYIIDSCYWIALYNPEKEPERTEEAEMIAEYIENQNILIPYPSLYEFLNSRFSRKGLAYNFEKLISRPNYKKVVDKNYRDTALDNFFTKAVKYKNDVSLVDEIIKGMIDDPNLKVDYLITFDEGLKNYAIAKGIKTN